MVGSEPTLDCFRGVAWIRVEAQLGLRSIGMEKVDQPFKQNEVARDRSHACADEDAIELLPSEALSNDRLCRFAKIDQAHSHVATELLQPRFIGVECLQYLRRVQAGEVRKLRG